MNHEGYRDDTADAAVRHYGRLPEPIWQAVKIVRSLVGYTGLELTGITLTDRKHKRKYEWEDKGCRKK